MKNTSLIKYFVCCATMILSLSGCKSLKEVRTFANCDFSFGSVSNVKLAAVQIDKIKSYDDLSASKAAKILSSYLSSKLNLSFDVNVDVKNTSSSTASFSGMDYIVWIDDMQMTTGSMAKKMTLSAGDKQSMPLSFNININDILKGKSKSKVLGFAFGLATDKESSSRLKFSFKPYFTVAGRQLKSPAYITIGGDRIMPK